MTFGFAPNWVGALFNGERFSAATPGGPLFLPPRRSPSEPACLAPAELAALVGELFAEGSLSWDQLRSLVKVPELEPHLRSAVAAVPPARRLLAAQP
jgi:hypothetical protein